MITGQGKPDLLNDIELINLNGSCITSFGNYSMPLEGATGVFVKDMVLVCGGSNPEDYQDECHTLHKGKTNFEFYKKLQEKRTLASSTVVQENMWITGGFNETNSFLKSTEFIRPQHSYTILNYTQNIDLPVPIRNHVILNLNETTSILLGGFLSYGFSDYTYFFNHVSNTWIIGPQMLNRRWDHTAGLIKDKGNGKEHIVVVGGHNHGEKKILVEILYNGENIWREGINLNV